MSFTPRQADRQTDRQLASFACLLCYFGSTRRFHSFPLHGLSSPFGVHASRFASIRRFTSSRFTNFHLSSPKVLSMLAAWASVEP